MSDQTSTYFQHALADDESGGRFAALNRKTVVGAAPPPLPAPAWTDPSGDEQPLGYRIDEVPSAEEYGFPAEARLEAQQTAQRASMAGSTGAGDEPSPSSPAPSKALRRI